MFHILFNTYLVLNINIKQFLLLLKLISKKNKNKCPIAISTLLVTTFRIIQICLGKSNGNSFNMYNYFIFLLGLSFPKFKIQKYSYPNKCTKKKLYLRIIFISEH